MKKLNRFIDIIAILFIILILSLLFHTVSNGKEPADPFIEPKLVEMGIDVRVSTPAEFSALIRADMAKWAAVVKRAGLQAE